MERDLICHEVQPERLLDYLLAFSGHAIRESLYPHFGQCTAFRGGALRELSINCMGRESIISALHSGQEI